MKALEEFLSETLSIEASALADGLEMKDIENWNSLTHIELIVGLEDLYGIQLSQDDVAAMTSVGAIKQALRRHDVALT